MVGSGRICHGCDFYPRPPRGGRPQTLREEYNRYVISIHALREEGDETRRTLRQAEDYFYPRPPRGGRPTKGGKK